MRVSGEGARIHDAGYTVEFSSEITVSLNFTAEHTENAEDRGLAV